MVEDVMEDKILVVEDDADINELLCSILIKKGYNVRGAFSGSEALMCIDQFNYDLILLDLMLPGVSGEDIINKIREDKIMPIIVISAKVTQDDKINILKLGADDYITKPFNPLELIARVKSQLRRYMAFGHYKEEEDLEKIKVGDLELDKRSKSFQVNGENVKITPIEYKILELLMSNAGRVYSAEAIYESAWGEPCFSTDTVMVHIRRIREKIEIDSKNPRYLKVVWGIGYKIDTN